MLNKCGNCSQVVAANDSECWHCGQMLAQNSTNAETLAARPTIPELGTIVRYVALTAVSLLLLILTTHALGQAPLLRSGGNNPLVGWQPVTDSQFRFTLNLPEEWQTIDLTTDANAQAADPVPMLADGFAALVADSDLLFLGVGEETAVASPFVLVGQSQRLARLSVEQFIAYAQQQLPPTIEVIEADMVTADELGIVKGQLQLILHQPDDEWHCTLQFVPTNTQIYLPTTCAPAGQFTRFRTDLEVILRSFQPLDS